VQKQANWNVDTTPEPIEWDDLIAEALERGKAVPEVTWRQPGEDGAWEVELLISCCQMLETHSVDCFDHCFASARVVLTDTTAHMVLAPLEPDTPVSPSPAPGSPTFASPSAVSATGRASVVDLSAPQHFPLLAAAGAGGGEGRLPDKGAAGALRLQAQRPQRRCGVGPQRLLPLRAAGAAAGSPGGRQAPQDQQGARCVQSAAPLRRCINSDEALAGRILHSRRAADGCSSSEAHVATGTGIG
jgi:hypothetical protein